MLNRKTKDVDASVELMEDRKKKSKICFYVFFIIGWTVAWVSIFLLPYKYGEIGIGAGIVLLILGACFWNDLNYYNILIMIKKLDEKG